MALLSLAFIAINILLVVQAFKLTGAATLPGLGPLELFHEETRRKMIDYFRFVGIGITVFALAFFSGAWIIIPLFDAAYVLIIWLLSQESTTDSSSKAN